MDQNDIEKKQYHTFEDLKEINMGSTELTANLFRATQTEEKLTRENIKGKTKANQTHFYVILPPLSNLYGFNLHAI